RLTACAVPLSGVFNWPFTAWRWAKTTLIPLQFERLSLQLFRQLVLRREKDYFLSQDPKASWSRFAQQVVSSKRSKAKKNSLPQCRMRAIPQTEFCQSRLPMATRREHSLGSPQAVAIRG